MRDPDSLRRFETHRRSIRRSKRSVPLGALALALGTSAVTAQTGPGIPNVTFPANEVFTVISSVGGTNKHGAPMLHNGYLTTVQHGPEGRVAFYDISNPYAPLEVNAITGAGVFLPEAHNHAQSGAWGGQHAVLHHGFGPEAGGGGTGIAIWDWTDVMSPRLESVLALPGVPGGYATGVWWIAIQGPWIYCPAGSHGLFVVDASDPGNPVVVNQMPTSETGGFNTVLAYAVGNTLILTNNDLGTGISRFDISDPANPQLRSTKRNMPPPYGARLNADLFLTPSVNGYFYLHDAQAPFDEIGRLSLGYRMSSATVQDQFVHLGGSNSAQAYNKLDIGDPQNPFLVGSTPSVGPDADWLTPIGHLVAVGDDEGGGTSLIPHQAAPDTTGPAVNLVDPPDGAQDQPITSRVGVTLSDMIELASCDTASFIVRPVGGSAVPGTFTHQFGVVNFTPDAPLAVDTTYEVVLPAGGLRDWAGNGLGQTFTSTFSTDDQAILVTAQSTPAVVPGVAVGFGVTSVSGQGPFTYSWDFGDGSPPTPFSSSPSASHAYAAPGHYAVLLSVTNGQHTGTDSFLQTVHLPLTAARPTHSSTIVMSPGDRYAACVDPDTDTVTGIDGTTLDKRASKVVGDHPRTLAFAPDETLWVVCQDDATIEVLGGIPGGNLGVIELPPGSAPYGLAFAPDGSAGYVTLNATGQVAKLDPASRTVIGLLDVGPDPRGIAIAADSERIFVMRFRSSGAPSPLSARTPAGARVSGSIAAGGPVRQAGARLEPVAEIYELSAASFSRVRTIPLHLDRSRDSSNSGGGLPNYLGSAAISPDGTRLWVPSKKDNILRGGWRDGLPLTFENTVRTIVSQVDLATGREARGDRIDFDDSDLAVAVEFSPLGDYAFHAIQGSNQVQVRDAYSGALVASADAVGLAPQGLAVNADGSLLFVQNFMSRSVRIHGIGDVTASTSFDMPILADVATNVPVGGGTPNEPLAPNVLLGKQIFYNAADPRMNRDGYLSCATCHLDGGQDGRVWDFTDRGEGLRNTISLVGRSGTGHGNVHWTANFDEIQDFEGDVRNAFEGDGFMDDATYQSGTVALPLGQPKAGLSPDLDALAAYVASLTSFGRSPHRQPNGDLTPQGVAGRALFASLGCGTCHAGADFTDSATGLTHDVGTLRPSSGQASGGPLTGLDTPTLRGLWDTAPYLHDGSAATLAEVLTTRNPLDLHGVTSTLEPQQVQALVAYLLQIDDLETGAP